MSTPATPVEAMNLWRLKRAVPVPAHVERGRSPRGGAMACGLFVLNHEADVTEVTTEELKQLLVVGRSQGIQICRRCVGAVVAAQMRSGE